VFSTTEIPTNEITIRAALVLLITIRL